MHLSKEDIKIIKSIRRNVQNNQSSKKCKFSINLYSHKNVFKMKKKCWKGCRKGWEGS